MHDGYVHERRTRILAGRIAAMLAPGATVVDVGAGDGLLAYKLLELRPDLELTALEVVAHAGAGVPVQLFDGARIPLGDQSVDAVLLVDVLHHAESPHELLVEARRVAREHLVVKDVTLRGRGASRTLHLMEQLANANRGIRMAEEFWTPAEWRNVFAELALEPELTVEKLGLYPLPASLIFERRMHFLVRLRVAERSPVG